MPATIAEVMSGSIIGIGPDAAAGYPTTAPKEGHQ